MNTFSAQAEGGWFELNTAFDYTKTKGPAGKANRWCCTGNLK
jgi:hypothetical protein